MDVNSTWIPTWHQWIMFHGHLEYFQKPPLGGRPNTNLRDHGAPNAHTCQFILSYHGVRIRMNRNSLKYDHTISFIEK